MPTRTAMWRRKNFRRASSEGAGSGHCTWVRNSWGKTGSRKKSTAEAVDAVKALKKRARGARTARKDAPLGKATCRRDSLRRNSPRWCQRRHAARWIHEIKFDGYRLLAVVADR